jgi:hydrogenase-1 operon protein HyaE
VSHHPLIQRLLDEYGYPEIGLDEHEAFIGRPGMNVLFFPGDPAVVRDATDVAVILPELVAACDGKLHPGVVTDTFGDGKQLKMEYGFREYPSLVFIKDGEYVGTISRVQDWGDYLSQIQALFAAKPKRAPGFSIPVVSEQTH